MSSLNLPNISSLVDLFSSNPSVLCVQGAFFLCALLLVFLVLFTTRDVLLRIDSFFVQLLAVIFVAAFPFIGFFLYLLVRPSRTLSERHLEHVVSSIHRLLVKEMKEEKVDKTEVKKKKA